ncbi:MAG: class I tRNA ligase family protein, partial [Oscillospiraceae bacterium]|nr:class I tRNA ligase family protein [Oscillospiraceae bacterium]
IPVFYCKKCGKEHIEREAMMHVSRLFGEHGSDVWYEKDTDELIPEGTVCKHCGSSEFDKENDIMDVWFDSGVSHAVVCEKRPYLQWPSDLYIEGSDQYRGWFQSSLLTSVAWRGTAPYKMVISHGWVVDDENEKMSKSKGNGLQPSGVIEVYGADVLRLWAASSDYHTDVRISDDILKQLAEAYRKIRNTARYILGNLNDFTPDSDSVSMDDLTPIDRWALLRLNQLTKACADAYESYDFHQVYHAVNKFCVVDMSNFYLDVLKDRLYCDETEGQSRRAAQTAMYLILDALVRIISPILAFTSDEIWQFMPHSADDDPRGVLFNDVKPMLDIPGDDEFMARWERIHQIREDVQFVLEQCRKEKKIGKSLEAKVILTCKGELLDFVKSVMPELPAVLIVSQVEVKEGDGEGVGKVEGLGVTAEPADGDKCARCWTYSTSVGQSGEHPALCARCSEVLR